MHDTILEISTTNDSSYKVYGDRGALEAQVIKASQTDYHDAPAESCRFDVFDSTGKPLVVVVMRDKLVCMTLWPREND